MLRRTLLWGKTGHYVFRLYPIENSTLNNSRSAFLSNMAGNDMQTSSATFKFLENVHKAMVESTCITGCHVNNGLKVTEFLQPDEIMRQIDFEIGEDGTSDDKLLQLCKTAMKHSVKSGHRNFFNQLYSGIDPYGLAGAWITEALNTNVHTFEVAPVFIMAEHYMINKICQLVGYPDGDGIFCPGGTMSNYFAIHIARFTYDRSIKQTGMKNAPKFHLYYSQEGHYSLKKGASFLGFGLDSLVSVPTNKNGAIIPEEFEKRVLESKQQGAVPLFMMATSGTTVLGAFDPLDELADICQRHGIWLHVDAAWGGTALVTKKHRHLMKGVERSDSFAWCLHKMIGAPVQCSALVLKQKGLLAECNSAHAEYLFQPDKCYDVSYDVGDRSLLCGRKGDALKIWLLWKAKGDKKIESEVDKAFETSQVFLEKVKDRDGFVPVLEEIPFCNVGFWYIPPSLREKERTEEWWKKLAKVAPAVKERMMHSGNMMLAYQPLTRHKDSFVNFFRIILIRPDLKESDLDFILDEIERLGRDL